MRENRHSVRAITLTAMFCVAVSAILPWPAEAERPPPPWGTGESRPEDIRVALITFGPGKDVASWFGHSAVLVEDTRRRAQRVYNYGMFSFGPDLLPKFLMGRLEFWVGESALGSTLRTYEFLNRDIRIQEMDLSPELRERLARALADNVLPENRYYMYHHYDDNCATRIRDIVDEVLGGQLQEFSDRPARMTLRDHTRRHSQHNPFIDFILMLWMNDEIDRPVRVWDEMFLPQEMERVFADFTYVDEQGERRPLVHRSRVHFTADGRAPVPERPSPRWPYLLVLGLLLGVGAVLLARWHGRSNTRLSRVLFGLHNAVLGLLVGLPALLLFLMWTITEHTVTYRNENLLLASPLTLLALPLGIGVIAGSRRAARLLWSTWLVLALTSLIAVLVKPLPWFAQDNWIPIALLLPMNFGLAAAWWWVPGLSPVFFGRFFPFKAREPSVLSETASVQKKSSKRSKKKAAGR